jgi:hypothetical protein
MLTLANYCFSCRLVCSDYEKTLQDIKDNSDKNFDLNSQAGTEAYSALPIQLDIPTENQPAAKDMAVCSRSWRWEWFALFFQFVILSSALVVTMCPKRLLRARFPLAVMLAIATVVIMVRRSCCRPFTIMVGLSWLSEATSFHGAGSEFLWRQAGTTCAQFAIPENIPSM